VEKYFNKLIRTNERQIEFGRLLGLNFHGLTVGAAFAMIHETIDKNFNGKELKAASEKQIELGEKFGFDFSKLTTHVASAYIKDILVALNFKSTEEQHIKPGDCVINKYDKEKKEHIVSSIGKEGYIFFKKTSGGCARYLIKIDKKLVKDILEKTNSDLEIV
jgi:hypothetical protein